MAKDDLEERTVFADSEPEEGGTLAISRPPPPLEVKTDPNNVTQNVREERHTIPEDAPLIERTGYAQEGVRISVLFAHRFGKRILGSRGHLAVTLNEPGVSTESGVKARQAIVLVPRSKGRGSTTIGWVDIPRCLAELKSYPLIADQHRSRKHEEI